MKKAFFLLGEPRAAGTLVAFMVSGRALAGALFLAAHLVFASPSYAQDRRHTAAYAKPSAVVELSHSRGYLSGEILAALIAAGFVPAIVMFARERRRRHE